MLILGTHTEDKGNQLERLARNLLKSLNYRNVTVGEISAGGAEIDVTAEWTLPGIKGNDRRRVLAECKATKSPIDMTQWQKFLGKVLLEEKARGEEVFGVFVALNGVNGNVWGHYQRYCDSLKNVSIVQGSDLLDAVQRRYSVAPRANIESILQRLSPRRGRKCRQLELVYYDDYFFWLLLLDQGCYSLLGADGGPIPTGEADWLLPLIKRDCDAHEYVDIFEESEALHALRRSMSDILAFLVAKGGSASTTEVNRSFDEQLSTHELNEAIKSLKNERLVVSTPNGLGLRLQEDQAAVQIEHRVATLSFMLTNGLSVYVIGSQFYDDMIDDDLLNYICESQGGIVLSDEERSKVLQLLQWSPRALGYALKPDPVIARHRQGEERPDDRAIAHARGYFLRRLFEKFCQDYRSGPLRRYFGESRGIREIDSRETLTIKGTDGVLLSEEVRDRISIAPAAESLGGGYVLVSLIPDCPDPWEWSSGGGRDAVGGETSGE